jgi:nucleoside triphosphate pyrophosphatase
LILAAVHEGAGSARAGVILSSRSPQRRAILEQLGVDFRVEVPEVEELTKGDPRSLVRENALRKARAVAARSEDAATARGRDPAGAADLVLGADTAVVLDGRAFGKPRDRAEAETFLRRLSGRTHEVMSGIAVREPGGAERSDVAVTKVRFRRLEQQDLDWYLATGEWSDRAGAYAIQGKGAALVEEIEGDYWNVVGLPVAALLRLVPGLLRGR